VFLPALGAVVIALLRNPTPRSVRFVAAFFTLVPLAFSLRLFAAFDRSTGDWFEGSVAWLPSLNVNYHLGVDGLSLPMVVLTGFLGLLAVLVSWKVELRAKEYFMWLLLLEMGVMGVFTSVDLLLFFLFWEVELIPMYMLISIWGSGRKEYSAIKFVVFTLFGSAFMLAGILALYFSAGTFNLHELAAMDLSGVRTVLPMTAVFLFIFTAFAIKLPIFPFHTWLPDAHTDAPTAVSVILAGVLLKMGGYGMLRINVGLFPDVARDLAPIIAGLAVISILYGAALTLRQKDLKRLIAYSSVSHMGYVLLGIFALSYISMTGAILQMVSHGFVTGLLFAMVGLVYDKTHERNLDVLGGLARQMPVIAVVFTVAGLASLGLPGTSGFAAEVIIFLGSFTSTAFEAIRLYTVLGVIAIVFTAGYILWMLQRTFYTEPLARYDGVPDADVLEKVSIFTFVAAIMVIGLYPAVVTDVIKLGVPALGF
jgi:NADH-quinone oxidoreductase subunit M